jgi:hypothetical protein
MGTWVKILLSGTEMVGTVIFGAAGVAQHLKFYHQESAIKKRLSICRNYRK